MNKVFAKDIPIVIDTGQWDASVFSLSNVLSWAIRLVFVLASVFVIYGLIFGALEWIQSGGEKEKVEKARKRITSAIVGLVILFLVFAGMVAIEQMFGLGMGLTKPIMMPSIMP